MTVSGGELDSTSLPTQQIDGTTAVVLEGNPDGDPPSLFRVMLEVNGHLVTIFAARPANDLVKVAQSLSP
jgi:hypothetical protein